MHLDIYDGHTIIIIIIIIIINYMIIHDKASGDMLLKRYNNNYNFYPGGLRHPRVVFSRVLQRGMLLC